MLKAAGDALKADDQALKLKSDSNALNDDGDVLKGRTEIPIFMFSLSNFLKFYVCRKLYPIYCLTLQK